MTTFFLVDCNLPFKTVLDLFDSLAEMMSSDPSEYVTLTQRLTSPGQASVSPLKISNDGKDSSILSKYKKEIQTNNIYRRSVKTYIMVQAR